MAAASGENITRIIDNIIYEGPSYHVWQAVFICEQLTKRSFPERKDFLFEQTGIKFRPYENYEYPPADIRSVTCSDGVIEFVLNFMGLYGVNSSLPRCYHEQVSVQLRTLGEGNVPLQNFLDIFNNRFYWLYYQAWKKYRSYLFINDKNENSIKERLFSFIGKISDTGPNLFTLPDFFLLKFAGVFIQRVRNKNNLIILLSCLFPKYSFNVKEFIPRWIELTDIPPLGGDDYQLGFNSLIGKTAIDYMSRICIEISNISYKEYLNFLPGTLNAKKIFELLSFYVNDGLEFDIKYFIFSEGIDMAELGDDAIRLGTTSWFGKPEEIVFEIKVPYEELISTI